MSYNTKNYTEQGGEKTVIGGVLEIKEGASVMGLPIATNQAPSTASTVSGIKDDLNALLIKLKNAALMIPDKWTGVSVKLCNSSEGSDLATNHGAVTSVAYADGVFTVTADISEMTPFDSSNPAQGVHKWIGLIIGIGRDTILTTKYNDYQLQAADVTEAKAVGGGDGDIILWLKCDEVVDAPKTFTLTSPGYESKDFTVIVEEATEE